MTHQEMLGYIQNPSSPLSFMLNDQDTPGALQMTLALTTSINQKLEEGLCVTSNDMEDDDYYRKQVCCICINRQGHDSLN